MPDAPSPHWALRSRQLILDHPLVMGVVNVTPDSFSDGGLHAGAEAAIAHGLSLVGAGADLVDVGGESTRPGALPVEAETEMARVLPVVEGLAAEDVVVSVDTAKAEVAAAALGVGAEVINDVSAGADPDMLPLAAATGAGIVLMHMRGTPRTMQEDPSYQEVVGEVLGFLLERAEAALDAGVDRRKVVIDPGIGFGKNLEHNLELLRRLPELVAAGYPVMVGASRKAFLGRITGIDPASARDTPTAATTALAVAAGAAAVRVHDVQSSRLAADVAWAVSRSRI